jgi:hypothetical protein
MVFTLLTILPLSTPPSASTYMFAPLRLSHSLRFRRVRSASARAVTFSISCRIRSDSFTTPAADASSFCRVVSSPCFRVRSLSVCTRLLLISFAHRILGGGS